MLSDYLLFKLWLFMEQEKSYNFCIKLHLDIYASVISQMYLETFNTWPSRKALQNWNISNVHIFMKPLLCTAAQQTDEIFCTYACSWGIVEASKEASKSYVECFSKIFDPIPIG